MRKVAESEAQIYLRYLPGHAGVSPPATELSPKQGCSGKAGGENGVLGGLGKIDWRENAGNLCGLTSVSSVNWGFGRIVGCHF